jgi:hypothetical protein
MRVSRTDDIHVRYVPVTFRRRVRLISDAIGTAVLLAIFCISSASSDQTHREMSVIADESRFQEFRTRVEKIENRYDDDKSNTILLDNSVIAYPEFQELASNPGEYIDACVRLISSPKLPDEERRIAGFAMHHLEVADYVLFIRKLLAEYRAGKVTTSDLIGTAFQVSPFFDVPIEHFDDPSVQRLLYYIVAIPGISPSDQDFIFSILSGQRWLDQREGCWEGNCMTDPLPPRLKEHAPSEFAFFTRKFSLDDFRNVPDRFAWISAIVRTNRADENAVIEKFLDTLLIPPSDGFTDYDLEYLWRIYNRSFVVSKPGEMRAFLTQIHDAIARQAPHP